MKADDLQRQARDKHQRKLQTKASGVFFALYIYRRDLKSPNLLLQNPPPKKGKEGDGKDLCCKISDFGLSRDKNVGESTMAATEMMTGCGSILWMAPEILLGEKYNEKVDVFSYAMCLLELTNRNLPWHGSGVGQQAIPVNTGIALSIISCPVVGPEPVLASHRF
jgi:serine/threonine protein kinase